MSLKVFIAVLVVALIPSAAISQTAPKKPSTSITGVVLGEDNQPVPNASVTCETSGGLSPRAVHTDSTGHFTISGLKQDSYDIRASANGAYSDWQRNLPLRRGQVKTVTLRVKAGPPPKSVAPTAFPEPQ